MLASLSATRCQGPGGKVGIGTHRSQRGWFVVLRMISKDASEVKGFVRGQTKKHPRNIDTLQNLFYGKYIDN